jgi:CHAT domain-containing protein
MTRLSSVDHLPTAQDRAEYIDIASKLYRKTIAPLESRITGVELMLIAPDGELNLVAFAGLADGDGRYLIERAQVHYLSAGRDLMRLRYSLEPGRGLFALGNPEFGAAPVERPGAGGSRKDIEEDVETSRSGPSATRGGWLRAKPLAPLPGTEDEIRAITSRWEETTDEPTVVCLGSSASEGNVKLMAPGMRIVHLATHGYFLGTDLAEGSGPTAGDKSVILANPLLASGLYFAGADLEEDLPERRGSDDGILTAFEVSAMDFTGTELVVLSACETGLGRLTRGEGVYGLRRAFELAGARTVVSALWQVSDVMAADMLASLYTESGTSIPQRMREMQLSEINKARSNGLSDHPHTWAAFVAVGDWQ